MKQKIEQLKKNLEPKANLWAGKIFLSLLKPFSRISRRVFELSSIKQALGALVLISIISMAILPSSIAAVQVNSEIEQAQLKEEVLPVETIVSVRLPIESFTLTQGYQLFHPGIDMAAVKGSPVYPVMDGIVESVKYERLAYGNHIIIDHGNGYKTLYAHLAKIEVYEGEKVTKDLVVGLIGSTGWSTGPHLHFQIWQEDKLINPRAFFESYFGKRLISTR